MATSMEDLEENMEELEMRMSCKFDALKQFTMNTLKEMRLKQELETMNESLGSLKEEFESFKTSTLQEGQSSSLSKEGGSSSLCKKRESDECPGTNKRLFQGFRFYPKSGKTSTPLPHHTVAGTLEEVQNPKLKENLRKYYPGDMSQCGNLSALQYAYFQMFFLEKKGGYTSKRCTIEQLIQDGVRDGIWEETFVPVGAKNGFFDYLKGKAKNKQKKKLAEQAMTEFVDEYAEL